MMTMMGNAPQTTSMNSIVPTTNTQIHQSGIQQQAKQQQVQQQALQQANVFLSVDPRLMDNKIAQFISGNKSSNSSGNIYTFEEEETESLAERGVSYNEDDLYNNPYAEARDFRTLTNIQPSNTQRAAAKPSNRYSVFDAPSGSFGLLA